MKKNLVLLMVTGLLVICLVGCSSDKEAPEITVAPTTASQSDTSATTGNDEKKSAIVEYGNLLKEVSFSDFATKLSAISTITDQTEQVTYIRTTIVPMTENILTQLSSYDATDGEIKSINDTYVSVFGIYKDSFGLLADAAEQNDIDAVNRIHEALKEPNEILSTNNTKYKDLKKQYGIQ